MDLYGIGYSFVYYNPEHTLFEVKNSDCYYMSIARTERYRIPQVSMGMAIITVLQIMSIVMMDIMCHI